MADKSNADSRHHVAVDTPQRQIPRDITGSDNPVPLSPQWLLPKPGDNKPGMIAVESHFSPCLGKHPDAFKTSGNGEEFHDAEKRSIVFRSSFHDAESGRHNRWRDEEREMNFAVRRDRWRDGERDKETADSHRERRMENSSRHSGEIRWAPSDRWNDSGIRDTNFEQRRESKWNTRWGPDDKESDGWREKRMDSGRDGEVSRDKGTPHQPNPGKDADKEGDHYSRPWRPNFSLTRGRGDSSLTPIKQGPIFGYGRGRGENGSSIFSAGHGKSNSIMGSSNSRTSHSHILGTPPDKPIGVQGDSSALRYSRMKLLDIYRVMDIKSVRKQLDGFIEVPSLTQIEVLEPLAVSVPSPEELVVLKGIDKGDIVSSGVPQVTKDVSVGQNSVDTVISRHAKLGTREDSSSAMDDKEDTSDKSKDDQQGYLDGASYERHMHHHGPDLKVDLSQNLQSHDGGILTMKASRSEGANLQKMDEAAVREVSMLVEPSSFQHTIPWRAESMGGNSFGISKDRKDFSADARSRTSDVSWSHLQKDQEAKWMSNDAISSSSYGKKLHWQSNEGFQSEMSKDLRFERQSSEVLDQEREADKTLSHDDSFISRDKVMARKLLQQPSPEELLLYYKDPKGQIQGPFSGSDLIGWFEAGYFGIDLQVRLADAPPDAPFSLLGNVMPHLQMKARPPPGFSVHKQIETVDTPVRGKLASQGTIRAALGELEHIKSGQRNWCDSSTEAENRFLESLMSGNTSNPVETFSFPEGVKDYASSTSVAMSTVAGEPGHGLNYLLAQRMSLEQKGPLPNHLPFWSGKDSVSMPSNQEFVLNSSSQNSKVIPPTAGSPCSHVDLLSILQAAAVKAPSAAPSAINTSVSTWSNFPDARPLNNTMHSGMDILKDNIEMPLNQQFASQAGYDIQSQWLQQLSQPSLSPMIPQPSDRPSNFVLPEKVLSSGISQDPNLLSMLQHQYLLSQLQLQSQMPIPSQLSLLDKFLLMKEHQKQEQQQLLLQQQRLLSRILSEHQSQQQFGESPYGHLQAAGSIENVLLDHIGLHQPREAVQINEQMEALSLQDGHAPNLSNLPMQVSQDLGCVIGSGQSALLAPPHFSDRMAHSKEWATSTQQIKDVLSSDSVASVLAADNSFPPQVTEKSSQEALVQQASAPEVDVNMSHQGGETVELVAPEEIDSFVSPDVTPETSKHEFSVSHQVNDVKSASENMSEQSPSQSLPVKSVKPVEGPGVKKASDKKSRKQKNTRTQSASEQLKGSSKSFHSQQLKLDPELEETSTGGITYVIQSEEQESLSQTSSLRVTDGKSAIVNQDAPSSQEVNVSSAKYVLGDKVETSVSKTELREVEHVSQSTMQIPVQRAWKPAPASKAKSLLEIQQEEQQRAQTEMFISDIVALSAAASGFSSIPWSGVITSSDQKSGSDVLQGGPDAQLFLGNSADDLNLKRKKSQLHDLLSEEVITKSAEDVADTSATIGRSSLVSPPADVKTQTDGPSFVDDDFVDAKDMKKSRKKAAKAKGAGVKSSVPVTLADPISSIPTERSKSARQAQQEEELLSVLPTGPSLGDFVFWKGDEINSAPAPAWSTNSSTQNPTSLRDILKEQEKNMASVPKQIPAVGSKTLQNRNIHGSSSWQISGTSPSTAASPVKNSSLFALTKSKTEEELFWGPLDQPKQESKQLDFPSHATSSSWGTKGTTSKSESGTAPVHPKASGRPEYTVASPVGQPSLKGRRDAMPEHTRAPPPVGQPSSKGKRGAMSKYSEAMDFREWCEGELFRLTGARETGFLEFCLKLPTMEAKTLLRENLGLLDPDHVFIDKFLNYKELLPADVIDIAFQSHQNRKADGVDTACGSADMGSDKADADMLAGLDGPARGGKKKGKKGKKVSPSVLGFNVVSNRIMMGEIQSVED